MIQESHNKDLREYSTFGLSGTARKVIKVAERGDIKPAVESARSAGLQAIPMGEGSNTVIPECLVERCVLDIDTSGIQTQEDGNAVSLKIAAGEVWDDIVKIAAQNGWAGITAMSAIPGSVGAAPVQNIGAYGQELRDVIHRVEAYDIKTDKLHSLAARECDFSYRNSLFKKNPGRFIVLSVTIHLKKGDPSIPDYGSVANTLKDRGMTEPTHHQLRDVITDIRWSKLPRTEETPNVGSFFTNPLVSKTTAQKLKNDFADMPVYSQGEKKKVPAGWLIDEVGLKGARFGTVAVSEDNALILTSDKCAEFKDLALAIGEIRQRVQDTFGIELDREPRVLY